jgi:hypothetical protein
LPSELITTMSGCWPTWCPGCGPARPLPPRDARDAPSVGHGSKHGPVQVSLGPGHCWSRDRPQPIAAAKRRFAAATALRRRADLGCRGAVGGSSWQTSRCEPLACITRAGQAQSRKPAVSPRRPSLAMPPGRCNINVPARSQPLGTVDRGPTRPTFGLTVRQASTNGQGCRSWSISSAPMG